MNIKKQSPTAYYFLLSNKSCTAIFSFISKFYFIIHVHNGLFISFLLTDMKNVLNYHTKN